MHSRRHAKLLLIPAALVAAAMVASGCGSDKGTSPLNTTPSEDPSPPTTPGGLSVIKLSDQGIKLGWDPSPEADLLGYEVYFYDPSPYRDNSYVKLSSSPVERTAFVFTGPEAGSTYYFKITAVNDQGVESAASSPLVVAWDGGPYDPAQGDDGAEEPPRDGRGPGGDGGVDEPGHPEDGEDDPTGSTGP